jgi:LysR family glycine cleavage system transcriptional activator
MNRASHRPLAIGQLRAFEAVARRLAFGAAATELHLTQPAVSRQIRTLEDELGGPLFLRGTRHVELTGAGAALLQTVAPLIDRLDSTVRQIRSTRSRRHVSVTTFASLASLWLIPRLVTFQAAQPDIDIRISATDTLADADDPELDIALRYCLARDVPAGSLPLFDEWLTPVASPALLERLPLRSGADLAHHTLLEEDDARPSAEYLSWHHWLQRHVAPGLEPRGWLYLNYTYQQIQAALSGQGVALARRALVAELIASGELVEPFGPAGRVASPYAYWLLRWPARRDRPEVAAFESWLLAEARATQTLIAPAQTQSGALR